MYSLNTDTLEDFCKDFLMIKRRALSSESFKDLRGAWYDRFCHERYLPSKTAKLGEKVCQLSKSPFINPKTTFVAFIQICPLSGPLQDDIRILDRKTSQQLYSITPKWTFADRNRGKAVVHGQQMGKPLVAGTWKEVKEYFKV